MASSVMPFASPTEVSDAVAYALHCSRDLPWFDPDKSVKHVVLNPRALTTFNRFLHYGRGWITLFYAIGFLIGGAVLFVRASVGEAFAVTSLIIEIPTFVAAYLMLRFDIVVLIAKTFEFWYVTAVNIVCTLLMALKFNDLRLVMVVATAFAYEIPFLMDAVNRATTVTVVASAMGAVADVVYIVVLMTDQLNDIKHIKFFAHEEFRFTVDSVVINGLATVIVLLLRNAYRKHQLIQTQRKTKKRVGTCIMFRCRLELRRVQPHTMLVDERVKDDFTETPGSRRRTQLAYAGSAKTFDVHNALLPQKLLKLSIVPWPKPAQMGLRLLGCVGLLLHSQLAIQPSLVSGLPVVVISFCASAIFCGTYWLHCQRQLLRYELFTSFDFVFMAFQFTLAHLCLGYLVGWNVSIINILTSWMWSHWIITLDAVTPVMKHKLGYNFYGAAFVVVVILAEQLACIQNIWGRADSAFENRVTINVFGMEMRVVSFLFWRLFTSMLWCSRLLWRLLDRRGDELLILQGQTQYDDTRRASRRGVRHDHKTNAVATT